MKSGFNTLLDLSLLLRHYVPPSGSLIKNAEKATIKKKMQQEAERLAAQEEQERERAKNHPARLRGWGGNGGGSG